jgi:hypothetical protein
MSNLTPQERSEAASMIDSDETTTIIGRPASQPEAATIRLMDIAEDITAEHGGPLEDALRAVTTLAVQCGYTAFEGGCSPDLEVSAEDAATIRDAVDL